MTTAPKAGDFVLVGSSIYDRPGVYRGSVRRVVRATASTAWLDNDDTIKADRSKYVGDPWRRVVHVPTAEAERWIAARAAMTAWKKAIPAGASWCRSWGGTDSWAVVEFHLEHHREVTRIDTAEEAERRAAIFVSVAAWLRAKPDEESLLIRIAKDADEGADR